MGGTLQDHVAAAARDAGRQRRKEISVSSSVTVMFVENRLKVLNRLLSLSAHDPGAGPASPEGDPEEPAGPLQELRRAYHHEDAGGSQRLAQGGEHRFRSDSQFVFSI